MDNEVNARLAAAAPVETLPREDLVRELRHLREENEGLRDTLESVGIVVGVTRDSPPGERSIIVAVHALMCRARDVVDCFKKAGGTGGLYLEASGDQAETALLELRKLTHGAQ